MSFLSIVSMLQLYTMIPKIIWQTHEVDRDKLPLFMQEISNTWINLNPEYTYIYMNAEERRSEVKNYLKNEEDLEQYDSLRGMFQADMWRYIMLYKHGGFYADMDSICTMSLKTMMELKYNNETLIAIAKTPPPLRFCPSCGARNNTMTRHKEFVNNANFGCIKESPLVKKIIDIAIDTMSGKIHQSIGPVIFSDVVLDNQNICGFFMDDAAIHDHNFQTDLFLLKKENNLIVNYLGKEISYHDLLEGLPNNDS